MKEPVMNKCERALRDYLIAVAVCLEDRNKNESAAQEVHTTARDCAGGRLSIEVCHTFCELGLNYVYFLENDEQATLWKNGADRERHFGKVIGSLENWERYRDRQLCEWRSCVQRILRSRLEIWLTSDRIFENRLVSIQRAFFRGTLEARRQFFVTVCDDVRKRAAAGQYVAAATGAYSEYETALSQALRAWRCSRSQASIELSDRAEQTYGQLGLSAGDTIEALESAFRRQIAAADKALELAATAAATVQGDKIEAARQALNDAVEQELIAEPPKVCAGRSLK
jgi:hypothetical protein